MMEENKKINENQSSPSLEAVADLIKCKICAQTITDSKMLPCQHTFCFKCLEKFVAQEKSTGKLSCPTCLASFLINPNLSSPKNLPKNIYVESLIKLFYDKTNPETNCVNCGVVGSCEEFCDHCKQNFCEACWKEHLAALKENFCTLMEQANESKNQLEEEVNTFQRRFNEIDAKIKLLTESQITQLKLKEKESLERLDEIKSQQDIARKSLMGRISDVKRDMEEASSVARNASLIMHFHNEIVDIVNKVCEFKSALPTFDTTAFKVEQNEKTETNNSVQTPSSIKAMANYYSTKIFCPKLIWTKCPRPSGIAIPPWNENIFYITTQDKKLILIMNRQNLKIIGTLSSPEMLFPHNLAFSCKRSEIYVSDKWKNCIHVFSKEGQYLRYLSLPQLRCPGGVALYRDELVVTDTGNDSVIILNPVDGTLHSVLGMHGFRTEFLCPTSVAVFRNMIIVADSGNYRIKVFARSGEKFLEFGSMGRSKGQFKALDVVTTDHLGFIFVGDSENKRIQVFRPNGKLARVFNIATSVDNFSCISGLSVTPQLDIVVTDSKSKRLHIF